MPTGSLPIGWYSADVFFAAVRTAQTNADAAQSALAAAAPEPLSTLPQDASPPRWPLSSKTLEEAEGATAAAVRATPTRLRCTYLPFAVLDRAPWLQRQSQWASGYALLFFRSGERLDVHLRVAQVRALPARPLRTCVLPPPLAQPLLSSCWRGCCFCEKGGGTHGSCFLCGGEAAAALRAALSGSLEAASPVLGVFDGLSLLTAYQLVPDEAAGASASAPARFSVAALWQADLSGVSPLPPLEVRFVGAAWLVLLVDFGGDAFLVRLGPAKPAREKTTLHRLLRLETKAVWRVGRSVKGVWMDSAAQLRFFAPLPFAAAAFETRVFEASGNKDGSLPHCHCACQCVAKGKAPLPSPSEQSAKAARRGVEKTTDARGLQQRPPDRDRKKERAQERQAFALRGPCAVSVASLLQRRLSLPERAAEQVVEFSPVDLVEGAAATNSPFLGTSPGGGGALRSSQKAPNIFRFDRPLFPLPLPLRAELLHPRLLHSAASEGGAWDFNIHKSGSAASEATAAGQAARWVSNDAPSSSLGGMPPSPASSSDAPFLCRR